MAKILPPTASVSFRGHPQNVWTEDGRQKMRDYLEKEENPLNGINYGGIGGILPPSAPDSLRVRPRHVWAGDGSFGTITKKRKIAINGRN